MRAAPLRYGGVGLFDKLLDRIFVVKLLNYLCFMDVPRAAAALPENPLR